MAGNADFFFNEAPAELTSGRLLRLGEGVGKVVYASSHWVVARDRSPKETVALIVLWRRLRRLEGVLPFGIGRRLLEKPSRQLRFLRVVIQALITVLPKWLWYTGHVREVWHRYRGSNQLGQKVADEHLTGSMVVPRRIQFPPTKVRIAGWPGWLLVTEATQRAEDTLHGRLMSLAAKGDFEAIQVWLDRFLHARQEGWRHGVFCTDDHLKNFGISGEQILLLDSGGLTNRWEDVEAWLEKQASFADPHVRLGLGSVLVSRPEIAEQFNDGWRRIVTGERIRECWESASGITDSSGC